MAEVSQITFSGYILRLTHENGTFVAATLANTHNPDPAAPVTQLGEPFSMETAASHSAKPEERLAAKVGEALSAGGTRNPTMLGFRLADKFVREHPGVVPD